MQRLAKTNDAWEAAQITRNMFLRPLSVQQGRVDVARNNSVRQYLNLPLEEQIANAQQQQQAAATANTQPVQPAPGQPQPAQPTQQATAPQSKALGQRRFVPDPNNPGRAILVGG
jgi:hypothetical protein